MLLKRCQFVGMLTLEEELRGEGGALAIEDGSFSLIKGQMMVDSCMAKMGGGIYLARSHLAQSGASVSKSSKNRSGNCQNCPYMLNQGVTSKYAFRWRDT